MTSDNNRAGHLEHVAVEVARIAADYVREHSGSATTARTKSSPTDVVTYTDMASERLIRSELLARCPGSTIHGEEYGDEGDDGNNVGWVVDPIDGTVNYLYDLPVVSVSIAATLEGEIVAAAVADVHRREIFSAARGSGARRDGEPIRPTSLRVLDQALVGTGFSYDSTLRARQSEVVSALLPACRDIRCMGSAALNVCWVGCGRLDGYYERDLKPYDYAAGALIAAEAGAVVELPSSANEHMTFVATAEIADALRSLIDGRT